MRRDDVDKSQLIRAVLTHYGFERVPESGGNRSIRCALHGDSHASASVNVDAGLFLCFTCGIKGDGYSVIMEREGFDFVRAAEWAEGNLDVGGGPLSRRANREGSNLPARAGSQRRQRGGVPAWKKRQP